MPDANPFEQVGFTWDDVVRLADAHTLAVQSWLSSRAPDAARFEGLGVRACSTGIGVPLLNLALGCDFPSGTGDAVIDDEIRAVKAFFARRSVPWYWWMNPRPSPPDIGERLARHGLIFDTPLLPAMAAALPGTLPAIPPDVLVWQAQSIADLQAASLIRRTAFRFPPGQAVNYFEAMPESWLGNDPARLYLAGFEGEAPAAIGALIMGAGLPGVYVMATLPDYERRGLGKAILARILNEAAADGHRLIGLTASRRGFALYSQFGFQHIFDYRFYRLAQ